jgi:hypothetical protein
MLTLWSGYRVVQTWSGYLKVVGLSCYFRITQCSYRLDMNISSGMVRLFGLVGLSCRGQIMWTWSGYPGLVGLSTLGRVIYAWSCYLKVCVFLVHLK